MATRRGSRKTTRTRRKKGGMSVIGLAETYLLTNVMTQAMFKTNPITFLTAGNIVGSDTITMRELLNPQGRFYDRPDVAGVQGATYYIGKNLQAQGGKAVLQMIMIPLAFRLGRKLGAPAISRTNRLLNQAGIGSTVKL